MMNRKAVLTTGITALGVAALPSMSRAALGSGSMTVQSSGLQSILRDSAGRVVAIAQSRFVGDPKPTLTVMADFVARIQPALDQIAAQELVAMRGLRPQPSIVNRACHNATVSFNWAVAGFVAAGAFLLANPVDPIAIGMFVLAEGAVSSARTAMHDVCG